SRLEDCTQKRRVPAAAALHEVSRLVRWLRALVKAFHGCVELAPGQQPPVTARAASLPPWNSPAPSASSGSSPAPPLRG
ncbi:MAG: hypothetical protein Q8L14_05765, partial [Myxococcales bacterium]|nr:hypothetical protein [Myxococcales bacterium]